MLLLAPFGRSAAITYAKKLKGLCHGCLVHFVNIANYTSLVAMELSKLLVNGQITASCQTNMSPKQHMKRYQQQDCKA